ncbi:MAG: hypothetical protein ACREQL_14335, partial [Candidatus Binatia bacterium]
CWPLFRYEHDPTTGRLHWSALGPLVEYDATADGRELAIRPLLWLRQRRDGADLQADFVYPVAAARWRDDDWAARVLLLSAQGRRRSTAADDTRTRFTLFPLVFYRDRGEEPADFGVLPLFLDLHDAFGFARIRSVAFPLFVRFEEARVTRTWVPFPFVSWLGGEDGHGVRVWPVFGSTTIAGYEQSGYAAWPVVVWSDRQDPTYGAERRRVVFPFVARLDGETRESRAYLLTGYTHSIDRRRGVESTGAPWPLVFRERHLGAGDDFTWRVAPFYGRSDVDGIVRHFYLWPLWRTVVDDRGDFHFRRRDALLLAWRSQWDWDDASGASHALTTLVGGFRSERTGDRASGQAPALLDALLPANRGIRALWAPLTALLSWETGPAGTEWELGYGLVGRRRGALHGPWYIHDDAGRE